MTVHYRIPKKQGETSWTDYPGIVYKTYPTEPEYVGVTIFFDGIPSRYGKVPYSEEPKEGCWTFAPLIAKDEH